MNQIAEVKRINEYELTHDLTGTSSSWHADFSSSSWVFVGGLPKNLTEGDVLCIMSEMGEIDDINLKRSDDTGKFEGFGWVKYEDFRSAVIAVDGLGGQQILGRSIRVDHCLAYNVPKKKEDSAPDNEKDAEMKAIYGGGGEGEGGEVYTANGNVGKRYDGEELEGWERLEGGRDLFDTEQNLSGGKKDKKDKKEKGDKKEKKEKRDKKEKKVKSEKKEKKGKGEKKVKSEKKKEKESKKDKKRARSSSAEEPLKKRTGGGEDAAAASWMGDLAPP
ncbi:hypothetical protein TrVE_jg1949 [Triparma verrucosa]|uniref:RRM domain-containing protein n=1 Tax=Triparma verrucosa TaxID=1606542 RepID=A0A9W7B9Z2_9STRA|nr:hypothetical protein TrVE_jg1949 [Triparma verrucosa]